MQAGAFDMRGFDVLDRKLDRMAQGLPERQQIAALEQGAKVILAEAKRLVPVLTGTLRDSLILTANAGSFSHLDASDAAATVYIGPTQEGDYDGFYGHFVEWGTGHSAAHPFMRPAVANKGEEAGRVTAEVLLHMLMEQAR